MTRWISTGTYAALRGVDRRTVTRWIDEGRALPGVLEIERTPGGHFRLKVARKADNQDKQGRARA